MLRLLGFMEHWLGMDSTSSSRLLINLGGISVRVSIELRGKEGKLEG